MKVYEAVSYITGEPQGVYFPGMVVEGSQAMKESLLLSGLTVRELDEAFKVYRMAVRKGADNMFSCYIECDEPDCPCYGAKWYLLFANGKQQAGPMYKESVDGVFDGMLKDYKDLYEIPFTDGEVDYSRLDRSKL